MSAAKEPSSENTKNPTILDVLLTSTLGVKVGEKGVSLQLMGILEEADYLDLFQSRFGLGFSAEKVLFVLVDGGHPPILVLLDFSAAFDTIDQCVLQNWFYELEMEDTIL